MISKKKGHRNLKEKIVTGFWLVLLLCRTNNIWILVFDVKCLFVHHSLWYVLYTLLSAFIVFLGTDHKPNWFNHLSDLNFVHWNICAEWKKNTERFHILLRAYNVPYIKALGFDWRKCFGYSLDFRFSCFSSLMLFINSSNLGWFSKWKWIGHC